MIKLTVPPGWVIKPCPGGYIITSPRTNGVTSSTAVFPDSANPAEAILFEMLRAESEE